MGGITQRPWTPTKRRGPIAAEYNSPGPACVSLRSYIGKSTVEAKNGRAPAFSFGARHNGKMESLGPGPGQYNVTGLSAKGKDTPLAVSLHGRPKDPKHDNFPAPGDYNPDKAEKVIHDTSPKYTFGLKTNVEKPLDTPAPNAYESHLSDTAPKYSFGVKTELEKPFATPAPNAYESHLTDDTPKYSFGYKIEPETPFVTPAPNAYECHLPDDAPKYSFGVKTELEKPFATPAPNAYESHLSDDAPKYSFGVKIEPETPFATPAPNAYESHLIDNTPKYSFGHKTEGEKPFATPAPNVYNIPSEVGDSRNSPSYTISGRTKEPVDERVKNPGPGQYNNVDPDSYKAEHSPAYTMSGRTNIPRDESIPGPGNYSPEKVVLDFPPAHSFGIKHSVYSEHY